MFAVFQGIELNFEDPLELGIRHPLDNRRLQLRTGRTAWQGEDQAEPSAPLRQGFDILVDLRKRHQSPRCRVRQF